jgi:hypothetical protein
LVLTSQGFAAGDSFPRLGIYAISSPHDYYDPAYQKSLAKLDVAIISFYPNWGGSKHTNMNETVAAIKKLNPSTRVFLYTLAESLQVPASSAFADYQAKVDSEDWWLSPKGFDSSKVLSDYGKSTYILNITTQSKKDSAGDTFGQWFAGYVGTEYFKPNPNIDGIYTDNVFWKPRRDGDWNGDGVIDSQNSATTQQWYRQGYRLYLDALKKAMPGKMQLANVADWGQANSVLTEYNGQFNGGVMEGIVGKSYSVETRGGWSAMMAAYRKTMAAFAAPKLALFQQTGTATDYRGMRYGLASCLMDDGYFSYDDSKTPYHGVAWFDEFDAKLGAAVGPPSTTQWKSGVFRRDFENGIALVNPKGNGAQKVTLEGDFVKLKGAQDPTTNSGATVREVTLQDRDGIILMRKNPVKRPAAPAPVTAEVTK